MTIQTHVGNGKTALSSRVVRLSELEDLTEAAALAGKSVDEVSGELAALPDGIHAVGLVTGDRLLATALDIEREVSRTGKRHLVRLRGALEPARALVAWALEASLASKATALVIGVLDAPGLADTLLLRGYRPVESFVTMRRTCGPRACAPLPVGLTELTLASIGDVAYLEVGNAAFAGTPGAFPLTPADFARMRSDPGFRESLVRVIADARGPLGFLRGAHAPGHPGEIEAIGLIPRARRRGLGRWLLHRCEQLLEESGADTIQLLVAASNTAALSLYLRDGYMEIARRDTFERDL